MVSIYVHKNMRYGLIILNLLLLHTWCSEALSQQAAPDFLKAFNENIFVASNYSVSSSGILETGSVPYLLSQGIDGFRFSLTFDKTDNKVLLKNPDGSYTPFSETLLAIRLSLEADTARILMLFLDFDPGMDLQALHSVVQASGLGRFLFEHNPDDNWPVLSDMVRSGHRLVVFSMKEISGSLPWLLDIVNYAFDNSRITGSVAFNRVIGSNLTNTLLFFNEYNTRITKELNIFSEMDAFGDPFFMQAFTDVWKQTGKTPNFIMVDRYYSMLYTRLLAYFRGLKTVSGFVTRDDGIFSDIYWEGLNCSTYGKYCFPLLPGSRLELSPGSPGYRFIPEAVEITETTEDVTVNFTSKPLKITRNLECYFPLDHDTRNRAEGKKKTAPVNVTFMADIYRGYVASFDSGSRINLSRAEDYRMTDNSFTITVWLKIPEYMPGKFDYCVLGSRINTYQQGIHLMVRNQRPYLGFYGNDLKGETRIEPGRWYHLAWRYDKLTGEQTIFVNGKLDAFVRGRPAFMGTDSLYVGIAGFDKGAYMLGELDDLCIWSRALSQEEIRGLSEQITDPGAHLSILSGMPVAAWIFGGAAITAFIAFLVLKGRRKKKQEWKKPAGKQKTTSVKPLAEAWRKNHIKLFGDFQVYDRDGKDITEKFTPKLKQLFLVLLLYSQGDKKGITAEDISTLLWKDYPASNRKNIRGVAILKLRTILSALESVELVFHMGMWSMKLSGSVYCDYVDCLRLLNEVKAIDDTSFLKLFQIVREGEIFKGESFEWLDDFKGFVSNSILDILQKQIEMLSVATDSEMILQLSDLIILYDPVNETALAKKLKVLVRQNNNKLARFTFERFCNLYQEMYGEKYTKTFTELIS